MSSVAPEPAKTNHFIDLNKIDLKVLRHILTTSARLKKQVKGGVYSDALKGRQLALVFEKPSTRTRVSFEVAMNQLGGNTVVLTSADSQLGRGETIADTSRVLSRYVDIIMVRTFKHDSIIEMSKHATVPVINGLSDYSHPCQLMADIMTFEERKGSIAKKIITWIGDCNNMANSWIQAAGVFGFELRICCPEELAPPKLPENIKYFQNPLEAAAGADCITTDTWISMGEENPALKQQLLANYQVNNKVMQEAKPDAIFLHCLPAHRGHEVTDSVLDGTQSAVWDEAENRLHVQKAILLWCLGKI